MLRLSGYARLHRSLLGHPAFRNDAEAMTFAWMILRASWKPCRVRYKGRAVSLNRGQLAISVRDLADAMDRDKAWIERLFKRLKSETMIETVTDAGVSVVTICNYAQYQAEHEADETQRETVRETDARQTRDTEQEDKEIKKEETLPSGRVRAPARKADSFPRPDWADPAVWTDFLANRKSKRLPNTPTAHKGFLEDIARETEPGWPPGRLLEVATRKGHGAIYPSIKGTSNGRQLANPVASNGGNRSRPSFARIAFDAECAAHAEVDGGWQDLGGGFEISAASSA